MKGPSLSATQSETKGHLTEPIHPTSLTHLNIGHIRQGGLVVFLLGSILEFRSCNCTF